MSPFLVVSSDGECSDDWCELLQIQAGDVADLTEVRISDLRNEQHNNYRAVIIRASMRIGDLIEQEMDKLVVQVRENIGFFCPVIIFDETRRLFIHTDFTNVSIVFGSLNNFIEVLARATAMTEI